MFSFLQQDLLL